MCIVQTYSHQSATIKAKPTGSNGVVQVDYFGVFTDSAAGELVPLARSEGDRSRVLLVRLDRAILACDVSAHAKKSFSGSATPCAVVVRPDQRAELLATCSELCELGMPCLVFLDYGQALSWADRLAAGLLREELQRTPHHKPLTLERDRLLVGCQINQPANEPAQTIHHHR